MIAAMVLVGSPEVASDVIGEGMSPFQGTALRFALAGLGIAIALRVRGEHPPQLGRRDWTILGLQAAAGSFLYSILLIVGLRFTVGTSAGVVVGTLPAVMAVLAVLVFEERLGRLRLMATAHASLAVLAVTIAPETDPSGEPADGSWRALGIALVLGAVGCEAVFLLLNRRLRVALPALTLSAVMCGLGFVTVATAASVELVLAPVPAPTIPALRVRALIRDRADADRVPLGVWWFDAGNGLGRGAGDGGHARGGCGPVRARPG